MSDKLRVEVQTPVSSGSDLEKVVDEDINEFDEYFKSLGNDPVVRSERAILKTYLHWKVKGPRHGEATGS